MASDSFSGTYPIYYPSGGTGYNTGGWTGYSGRMACDITIAAITGVTIPVTGATPDTTVDETTQYTAAISWTPADTTFKGSTVYTATITIIPKKGYTLKGVPADFFTVAGAVTTHEADSGVVTAVFPETDENAVAPTITEQPTNATILEGNTATFEVSASASDGGMLSYQWQKSTDNGASWTDIAGATSASYTTGDSGSKYRCIVTNTKNSTTKTTTSNAATLFVNELTNAESPTITAQPEGKSVSIGDIVTLSITATVLAGGTITYQWYSNTTNSNSGGCIIEGATSNTYTAPTNTAGTTYYYCVVTNTDNSRTGTKTASTASSAVAVQVNTLINKEEKPNAVFTATGPDTGTLSGVESGMKYKINNGEWIDITSDSDISLTGLTACTISVIKKGDRVTTTDSDVQILAVNKAAMSATISKSDCTAIANNDGKLIGITAAMEYKLSTASSWTSGTGNDITGLASGTYYVRVKANGNTLASDEQIITIDAYIAPVTEIQNGGSITDTDLDKLISDEKALTVEGDNGARIVFGTDALKGIAERIFGEIKVEMKDVSNEHKENFPGKQVFILKVSSGNDTISNFGGSVTVSLPYKLKEGESAKDITVWFIASDGTMTEVPSTYDPVRNIVTFTSTNFDIYAVGVKELKPEPEPEPWVNSFIDVKEKDWFYEAVKFTKQNGLFAGTSSNTFSPNIPMTRAMLWTVLGRLNGHDFSGSNDLMLHASGQ